MMLKMKISATIFVLYEIIAVLLLHNAVSCNAMFGMSFCGDSVFKYFIALFAVPAIIGLIVMWIMHIIHAIRRRHSFLYRAQEAFEDVTSSIKKTLRESVSGKDIEKYIVAALAAGVKKYSDRNPQIKKSFGNILDAIGGTEYIDVDAEYDDDADDADDDTTSARRTQSRHTTSGSKSRKKSGNSNRRR